MDKQEKEKKAHEIAAKVTDEIVSNYEPYEMGLIASLILKNLHSIYQTRIEDSETNLRIHEKAYAEFLNSIDLPLIEDKDHVE